MSRFLVPILSLLLCFFAPARLRAEPKIRIGVITPLSGSLVASGESVRDSVVLADELFDKDNLVTFSFEDDAFLPRNSVSIAKKFIEEKADAIIIFGTPTAFAVVPITEQAMMPLLAVTIVDKVVAGRRYALRHFVAWQEENRRVIEEAKRRGYRKVAVVTTVNDATLSLRDGFIRDAQEIEVALSQEFNRDDLDFQAAAAKIKSLKPDAVYHLLFAPQGSAFMKALRRVGCDVPVFAVHNVEDPSEVAAAQGTYEGIWFATGDDRAGEKYLELYRKRFGKNPAMGWANAFDYAKMVIEAAERGKPLLGALKGLKDFQGAFGQYGAAEGNTFALRAVIKTVQGGRFVSDAVGGERGI